VVRASPGKSPSSCWDRWTQKRELRARAANWGLIPAFTQSRDSTGRTIHFETVDVMRVRGGKITEHWGVANLFSLLQQLGARPPATAARS
jgi:predicted SnoaL-like aldol condensation-catalyzing enzyme